MKLQKLLTLITVVLAGEAIFMHPFLVPRLYRSLIMEVWGLNNVQIGLAFSAYGITAMFSYVLGGPFADKFEPRRLIVVSLLTTVLGSCLLLYRPSAIIFIIAYGFFGVSTIFLMWSAMLKVTHQLGGRESRTFAMGVLEGGRGFVAALMSSFLIFIVSFQIDNNGGIENPSNTLRSIYFSISVFMIFAAGTVWFGIKNIEPRKIEVDNWTLVKAKNMVGDINLWLLSIIVLSAYCSYKNIGNYAVYMNDIKGMSIAEASKIMSYIFWFRPLVALLTGIFADKLALRIRGGRFITLLICFSLGAITQLLLACNILSSFNLLFSTIVFSSCFAFALRSIYFSVFSDLKIRDSILGAAIGVVSLVGFLPDFFFGVLTGYFIDNFPGQSGFSLVFLFNGLLLLIGALASFTCYRRAT